MDVGKLKSVAILILALVNLAFGGILLSERLDTADLQAQTRQALVQVMAGFGVALDPAQIPAEGTAYRWSIGRDRAAETTLVQALLGDAAVQDQGGNIYYYENDRGWARFRSSGSFEIIVLAGGGPIEERLAVGGLTVVREGDEYVCTHSGSLVFNCRFALSSLSGGLRIAGRRLPGPPLDCQEVTTLDAATLLLRFQDQTSTQGVVYTRIQRIRRGYALQVTAAEAALVPVWHVETDGGDWYLDIETGSLQAIR